MAAGRCRSSLVLVPFFVVPIIGGAWPSASSSYGCRRHLSRLSRLTNYIDLLHLGADLRAVLGDARSSR